MQVEVRKQKWYRLDHTVRDVGGGVDSSTFWGSWAPNRFARLPQSQCLKRGSVEKHTIFQGRDVKVRRVVLPEKGKMFILHREWYVDPVGGRIRPETHLGRKKTPAQTVWSTLINLSLLAVCLAGFLPSTAWELQQASTGVLLRRSGFHFISTDFLTASYSGFGNNYKARNMLMFYSNKLITGKL